MIRRPPRSTLFPYTDALPIADRFLRCGQFGVPGDVQRNGHRLGDRGIGEALLTRLVSGVSRGEAAAQAVERSRPGMARALREASTKIDFRSAPCAGGDSNQTPSGPGHQRGSPSRGASTARISPDAAVFGARLQRRYLEEKAASGAAASSAAANGVASGVLRLCWRRAAGRGDGAKCRRASDRSAGPLSDRTTLARRAPGVSYWFPQRTAERAELAAQRPGIVVSGTRGRRRSGGRGSNLRRGGKRREIRPFDDDADGDLLAF